MSGLGSSLLVVTIRLIVSVSDDAHGSGHGDLDVGCAISTNVVTKLENETVGVLIGGSD